jgi:outer membrane receptor protein involved in Fe transport
MRKVIYLWVFFFCYYFTQAQDLSNAKAGRFYGRIIEASTHKGIEAASVQLYLTQPAGNGHGLKDSLIDGMLTTKNGDFSFDHVPLRAGLKIIATAIGFEYYEEPVSFSTSGVVDEDLGNINLKADPKILQTVTVTASRPTMSLGIDRKVFNVEKNLTSAGGTAEDVMRSVPSLSVDLDGNLSLRNSAPQIFVDGRPTTMTLEQIPADAIQSVEIITNPSAKFDASGGMAGIVNIVLKKNRRTGYNGTLRAGIDQRGGYTLGGDFNARQNKINLFASINYRERKSISTGKTDRLTFLDSADTRLFQSDKNISKRSGLFARAGFDYLMDNRNTLTLSGYISNGNSGGSTGSNLFIDSLYESGTRSSYNERLTDPKGTYKNQGLSLGYKHLYAREGKEWTADLNYYGSSNNNSSLVKTSFFDYSGGTLQRNFNQLNENTGNSDNLTIQTDYTDPITKNAKVEFGARANLRNFNRSNLISYNNQGSIFTKVPQLSSDYTNNDNVYAAYGNFSNKHGGFGYELGLRVESSSYDGVVHTVGTVGKDTAIEYGNKFPLSFFPSIFLTQDLGNDQQLQFNVTRRINRPDFWQLFPFTDYSDSLNLSRGNPALKPEFTYSAELSYEKTFQRKNTLLASLYFKYTDQLITRFQEVEFNPVSQKENLINTYVNANSSYVGGLELINHFSLLDWWELTGNINLFTSRINAGNMLISQQDNIYSWFAKLNNTIRLPANFSIQLSGEYHSKTILPEGGGWRGPQASAQGYIRPRWEIDGGIKFEFLKDKRASVTLNVNDIFRSDASNTYSASRYFIQNSYRLRDPQFFRLNFSWRFGEFDVSLFKRKNKNAEQDPAVDL